jgi:4-amino-4-deoxy-L-arabinose transferase-like glycosyltransferase
MVTADVPSILQRKNLLTTARLVGAVVLAGLATNSLRARQVLPDGLVFLAGAAVLFLWALAAEKEPPWPALAEEGPLARQQWLAIGLSLIPAVLAWFTFADNHLSRLGLLLLGGALAMVVLAGWQKGPPAALAHPGDILSPRVRLLALLGIVLLAAWFRLYQLDKIPGDAFNDLAYNYEETARIMRGEWMIYATGFPGREPLLFYLTALLAQVTGLNFFTLKLITALVGIATVPVIYLLGRELFSDAVGLVAALFLAVAKWHVLISRVGFRGIQTALVAALVLCFLVRGLKRGRRGDLLWAGFFAGLALYTYTAALAVLPAVVLGLGLYALAGHGRDLWRVRRSLLLALLLALLVALPMLRYMFVDGSDLFWSRPLTRVSEKETSLPGPWGTILLDNLERTAGMLHVQGDGIFRTNVPFDPHLDVVAGALFLLGFPLVLARWRQGGNALVLVFLVVMLLPTSLSLAFPQEVPGAVRASGGLATVMLFPAVAVTAPWQWLGRMVPALRSKWAWGSVLAFLALVSGLINARLCFVEYPKALPYENYPLYREIARVIDEFGSDGPVLLKTIPFWDDKDAIRIQTEGHQEWGLHGEIITQVDPAFFAGLKEPQGAVIVNPVQDFGSLQALQHIFPDGVTIFYRDAQGQPQFAVFLYHRGGEAP